MQEMFSYRYRSLNYGQRLLPVSMLVLHYTGMRSAQEALECLCHPQSGVSAHYCIDEDGTVYALVDEVYRAWHAGVSRWGAVTDVNSASIGIELVNPGHQWGYRPFPAAQMSAMVALVQRCVRFYAIRPENVVGHSDVAPGRKKDPGELFPWHSLADTGLAARPMVAPVLR